MTNSKINLNKYNIKELLKDMGVSMRGGASMGCKLDSTAHTGNTAAGYGFPFSRDAFQQTGIVPWGCSDRNLPYNTSTFSELQRNISNSASRPEYKIGGRRTRRTRKNKRGGADSMACATCGNSCNCGVSYEYTGQLNNFPGIPEYKCSGCLPQSRTTSARGGRRRKNRNSRKQNKNRNKRGGSKKNRKRGGSKKNKRK